MADLHRIEVLMIPSPIIPYSEQSLQLLRQISPRLHIRWLNVHSVDEVPRQTLGEAEALLTAGQFPNVALVPRLRWLALAFAGVDGVQTALRQKADLRVTTASGVHATSIGEYVLGVMLALTQRVPTMLRDQAAQVWPEGRPKLQRYTRLELRDLTLGIVGYGSIGREVARLAECFGMRVLAAKRNPDRHADPGWVVPGRGDPLGRIPAAWYGLENLDEMLAQSDVLLLALPATPETTHLINRDLLRHIKHGALLINVGRGSAIDEAAMIDALDSGQLGGAGLDVTEEEPLPAGAPLWEAKNLILSPHISGVSPHYGEMNLQLFAENLRRYAVGEALLNEIDAAVGY